MNNELVTNTVFQVKGVGGTPIDCEILFTFASDETKKNYIVYTDNSVDEMGATRVYANVYDPNNASKQLMSIETEEEWNTIEAILEKLEEKSE